MPKLAIYVPKEQMRQIEKWRKRINFSRVFMTALQAEIQEQSREVRAEEGQVAAAAKYYQRKLAESCQPLEDAGFELGGRHVLQCRLAPDQIRRLLIAAEAEEMSPQSVADVEAAMGEDNRAIDATYTKMAFSEEDFPGGRQVAYRGYVKGVAAAWKQVCEQMRLE